MMLRSQKIFLVASKRAYKNLASELSALPFQIEWFHNFSGEPTWTDVRKACDKLQLANADCVLAVGGGSAIDLGKAVSIFSATDGLTIDQLESGGDLNKLPLIAVPTTTGSGSEVTDIIVITDEKSRRKHNPKHKKFVPDVVILDPLLTVSMPKSVTAQTGMDALTHAIEAYLSTLASPLSDLFALEAIKLIGKWLKRAFDVPDDLDARDGMIRASMLAGLAFSNASTNLAHATARPIGARFDLPHGLTVALTLPYALAFGSDVNGKRYENIADVLGTDDLIGFVTSYNEYFGLYKIAGKTINVEEFIQAIPILVDDALSGNGISTNRKTPTKLDVTNIYEKLAKDLMEG